MNKTTWRILSKAALLLVLFGFFQPVACNMNAFEIAGEMDGKAAGIAIYALFAFSWLGLALLIPLLMNKKTGLYWDWLDFAGIGVSFCIVFNDMRQMMPQDMLQSGAYFIITGMGLSLLCLVIASCMTLIRPRARQRF